LMLNEDVRDGIRLVAEAVAGLTVTIDSLALKVDSLKQ